MEIINKRERARKKMEIKLKIMTQRRNQKQSEYREKKGKRGGKYFKANRENP